MSPVLPESVLGQLVGQPSPGGAGQPARLDLGLGHRLVQRGRGGERADPRGAPVGGTEAIVSPGGGGREEE